MADFVEICNVCVRKVIIEAAKRIINSDKACHSYSDLNFGVTFLEHSVIGIIIGIISIDQLINQQFISPAIQVLTLQLLCPVSQSLRVDNGYGLDGEEDPFASKFMSFEV